MDSSKVSVKLRHAAKDLGTEVSNFVMADLISIGYSEADAYAIAYPERVGVYSLQQIQSLRDGIVNSMAFQELVDSRKELRNGFKGQKTKSSSENEDIELIDSTTTAKEILAVAMNMPQGSKERGEMFVKYSELLRKNSQQLDDEEDPVRIFLPLKCNMCTLYQNYLEENRERKNKKTYEE